MRGSSIIASLTSESVKGGVGVAATYSFAMKSVEANLVYVPKGKGVVYGRVMVPETRQTRSTQMGPVVLDYITGSTRMRAVAMSRYDQYFQPATSST